MSPVIKIICDGWLYMRCMHFRSKGDIEEGHAHPYGHFTILSRGGLEVKVEGRATVYECSEAEPVVPIWIEAHLKHELRATQDNTWAACTHALHDPKDRTKIFDPKSIPVGINPARVAAPLTE